MCGRIDIQGERLSQGVSRLLGFDFDVASNRDLRPTQTLQAIILSDQGFTQMDAAWGIKPAWSKQLLINAKAETVAQKPTFKKAFRERRCIVPCSGWYEWRDEGGAKKQKYHFQHSEGLPLLMAAIWYPSAAEGGSRQIVTLTTAPNSPCAEYHSRMPLLIEPEELAIWLGDQSIIPPLLIAVSRVHAISIAPMPK